MNMCKEIYERLDMDVTEFDAEDVITTSAVPITADENEQIGPVGFYSEGL